MVSLFAAFAAASITLVSSFALDLKITWHPTWIAYTFLINSFIVPFFYNIKSSRVAKYKQWINPCFPCLLYRKQNPLKVLPSC